MSIPVRRYKRVRIAQALFFLDAAMWLILGVTTLMSLGETSEDTLRNWVIFVMMLMNAGAMLWIGLALGKRQRMTLYFAVMLLIINLVLTITDRVGLIDFFILLLDLGLLGILIATRDKYTHD